MPRISIPIVIAAGVFAIGARGAAPLAVAEAYREGPVTAMTGGFGEDTCRVCHFDNPLNDPAGAVRLVGLPTTYTPGREFEVSVELERPDLTRGGFELSARFASGRQTSRQAGQLRPADALTRVIRSDDGTLEYAQHTAAGSRASDGLGRWTLLWTAPEPGGDPVVFHLAANASNADASALGDFIYTASVTIEGRSD